MTQISSSWSPSTRSTKGEPETTNAKENTQAVEPPKEGHTQQAGSLLAAPAPQGQGVRALVNSHAQSSAAQFAASQLQSQMPPEEAAGICSMDPANTARAADARTDAGAIPTTPPMNPPTATTEGMSPLQKWAHDLNYNFAVAERAQDAALVTAALAGAGALSAATAGASAGVTLAAGSGEGALCSTASSGLTDLLKGQTVDWPKAGDAGLVGLALGANHSAIAYGTRGSPLAGVANAASGALHSAMVTGLTASSLKGGAAQGALASTGPLGVVAGTAVEAAINVEKTP